MHRAVLAALLVPSVAAAADPGGYVRDARPYVFSSSGHTLEKGTFFAEVSGAYNGVTGRGGALQPEDARSGVMALAVGYGALDRLQLDVAFQFGDTPTGGFGFVQTRLDARVMALKPTAKVPVAIAVGAGYQADALLQSAVTGSVAVTAKTGPIDSTASVRLLHYFHPDRDPVDVVVSTGFLARATRHLQLGAEYVGEELEALSGEEEEDEEEADGGDRHYVGPTGVVTVADGRVRLNATAGVVIAPGVIGPLVRGSVGFRF
jgi:hypothetical protein